MKKLLVFLAAGLFACGPASAGNASDKDAVAMVEKAIAYAQANGKDKLIAEVNRKSPEFVVGELYIVVASLDGVRLAHGANHKLVGRSLLEIEDVDGKFYGKELVALAKEKGKGWVDYKFKNPVNGKVEPKTSYLMRAGDIFAFAGIYK